MERGGRVADYVLHLTQEENVVLGADTVRRLIESQNGDAALLYLCIALRSGSGHDKLAFELGWDLNRLAAAEDALCALGLIRRPVPEPAKAEKRTPPPETALPEYSREDILDKLENDGSFAAVLHEVERKLGRLTEPSVKKLLGLYDYLGLPANVIFLLLNHCVERKAAQFGEGKLPTMRDLEKEGYAWARKELFTAEAADAYLQIEREKRSCYPDYMAALRLGDRAPVASEEKYLGQWLEWGFPAETVAIAYDKTILNCHEFKWPYCNGILRKWQEKGIHTPDEARAEITSPRRANRQSTSDDPNAWMDEFIK